MRLWHGSHHSTPRNRAPERFPALLPPPTPLPRSRSSTCDQTFSSTIAACSPAPGVVRVHGSTSPSTNRGSHAARFNSRSTQMMACCVRTCSRVTILRKRTSMNLAARSSEAIRPRVASASAEPASEHQIESTSHDNVVDSELLVQYERGRSNVQTIGSDRMRSP